MVLRRSEIRSADRPVEIGVPQGSLLGPVLWNIFVDYIPAEPAQLIKFADNTTAFSTVSKGNNSKLQDAATAIYQWSGITHLTMKKNGDAEFEKKTACCDPNQNS